MVDDDPQKTQRDVRLPIAAELSAAGFEDAAEIGRGGFGVVYHCNQIALNRVGAVRRCLTWL